MLIRRLLSLPRWPHLMAALLPSRLKVAWHRARGARIGPGTRIGFLAFLVVDDLELGEAVEIHGFSLIRARTLRLGDRCRVYPGVLLDVEEATIGNDSVLMDHVTITNLPLEGASLRIGSRVRIFPRSVLDATAGLVIGSRTGIGGNSHIFTHGSWLPATEGFPARFAPVVVEERAWIAWNTFLLPGVRIGREAIVSGGSVVVRDVDARSLVGGAPARVLRKDGEHVTAPSGRERHRLLCELLEAFAAREERRGHLVSRRTDPGSWQWRIEDGPCSGLLAVGLPGGVLEADPVGARRVVVLEPGPGHADRSACDLDGVEWLDLDGYEHSRGASLLCREVAAFLGHWGIYFAPAAGQASGVRKAG